MSKSSDDAYLDAFTLSNHSIARWLDSQDDGWQELPDDREFARLEYALKHKRFSRVGNKLRSILPKRRRYAYQPV